jgi:hypothetical protein
MTDEEAKLVLLEQALEQAISTIEFLNGCLLEPTQYNYAYPEQTQQKLTEFKKLIVINPRCIHSMYVSECESCQSRSKKWEQKEAAVNILNSNTTYKVNCVGCGLSINSKAPQGKNDLCSFCLDSDDFK